MISQTSLEAYDALDLPNLQRQVYESLRDVGPMSNREIAHVLRRPEKSITGRTGELRDKGLIREHGKQFNANGRRERVWEAVP